MTDQRNNLFLSKKKFKVMIRDVFNAEEDVDIEDVLKQVDPTEMNERDLRNAVRDPNMKVPVPEVEEIPEAKFDAVRCGVYFEAPVRCFNYDKDFFEPITYYADDLDYEFIDTFNKEHKFLRISVSDLERIFVICEEIVKDSLNEVPTLSQVMLNLGLEAPPYAVCSAIFQHWMNRDKQSGSVIRWLEFPPEHCQLRQQAIKSFREMNKSRKGMKGVDYLRHLFQNLTKINEEKQKAIELLEVQEKKRLEDERFLREKMRQINLKLEKEGIPSFKMILETPIKGHEKAVVHGTTEDPNGSAVPNPPATSKFLRWCMSKRL